jgi:hypothetical protein
MKMPATLAVADTAPPWDWRDGCRGIAVMKHGAGMGRLPC